MKKQPPYAATVAVSMYLLIITGYVWNKKFTQKTDKNVRRKTPTDVILNEVKDLNAKDRVKTARMVEILRRIRSSG